MGLGATLMEATTYDPRTGHPVVRNLADGTRWVVTLFDAAGTTPEDPHFRGYNSIAFLLDAGNHLIGSREYFGDVKPNP